MCRHLPHHGYPSTWCTPQWHCCRCATWSALVDLLAALLLLLIFAVAIGHL
jgi:hypothetical protein